ncbi:MAG: hypothetical protein ACQES2_11770 [Pseudomonadota bacterium]
MTDIAILIYALVTLGFALGIAVYVMRLRRRIERLQLNAATDTCAPLAVQAASQRAQRFIRPDVRIEVTIDNPITVAQGESQLAGLIGTVAPKLIHKRVYQVVQKQLADELAERGVAARVKVVGGRQPLESEREASS